MKKVIILLALFFMCLEFMAQVPAGFAYQAVVRSNSGDVVVNKTVKFRFTILQNSATGTSVYVETQSKATNEFGLANLVVGSGTKVSGNFDPSAWGNNSHFLKVELDPNNGNTFGHLGTMQLMAVPYAFHARTSETIPDNSVTSAKIADGTIVTADLANSAVTSVKVSNNAITEAKIAAGAVTGAKISQGGATSGQVLKWTGTTWAPATDETGGSGGSNPTGPAGGDLTGTYPNPTIGAGMVTEAKIAGNAVTSAKIADGTIVAADLANNSVTTAKIANNAVTIAKLPAGATASTFLRGDGTWVTAGGSNWILNEGNVYRTTGRVGIGTTAPAYYLDLHVSGSDANMATRSTLNSYIYLERGATSSRALMNYRTGGTSNFWTGLSANSNSYMISTNENELIGLEVNTLGRVKVNSTTNPATLDINAESNDAIVRISRGGTNRWAVMEYRTGSTVNWYAGTWPAIGNFRVSKSWSSILEGIEVTSAGNFNVSGVQTNNKSLNINKGVPSGTALSVNDKEALFYNGDYYRWGNGANYNYFAKPVSIKTVANPAYDLVVAGTAAKTGGGSWTNLSDARLKTIDGLYTKGLQEVLSLRPVAFHYLKDNPYQYDPDTQQIGFVAQEVQEIFPEAVGTLPDGYLDLNMHAINVALVNAIKELKAENDRLKAESREQDSRIERLERLFSASAQNEK